MAAKVSHAGSAPRRSRATVRVSARHSSARSASAAEGLMPGPGILYPPNPGFRFSLDSSGKHPENRRIPQCGTGLASAIQQGGQTSQYPHQGKEWWTRRLAADFVSKNYPAATCLALGEEYLERDSMIAIKGRY